MLLGSHRTVEKTSAYTDSIDIWDWMKPATTGCYVLRKYSNFHLNCTFTIYKAFYVRYCSLASNINSVKYMRNFYSWGKCGSELLTSPSSYSKQEEESDCKSFAWFSVLFLLLFIYNMKGQGISEFSLNNAKSSHTCIYPVREGWLARITPKSFPGFPSAVWSPSSWTWYGRPLTTGGSCRSLQPPCLPFLASSSSNSVALVVPRYSRGFSPLPSCPSTWGGLSPHLTWQHPTVFKTQPFYFPLEAFQILSGSHPLCSHSMPNCVVLILLSLCLRACLFYWTVSPRRAGTRSYSSLVHDTQKVLNKWKLYEWLTSLKT